MSRIVRRSLAALVTSAMLFAQVAPAFASDSVIGEDERAHSVPVVFDALFLRPIGMMVTALGTGAFCMLAPIMAITRPMDMGKPFHVLVVRPARYTWVDPLGTH